MGNVIDSEISHQKKSQKVDLSQHHLSQLPNSIKLLKQCEDLNLSDNTLSDVPTCIRM
jgi:Leucine-rich repeat (LRR) protein